MKNIYAKILLILFILQMVAQIALVTGANPFANFITPTAQNNISSKSSSSQTATVSGITQNKQITLTPQQLQSIQAQMSSNSKSQSSTNSNGAAANAQASSSTIQTNGLITPLDSGGGNPISLQYSAHQYLNYYNYVTINVGSSGNSRLIVIFAGVESTSSQLTGSVTVGGQPATLLYKAQNTNSLGLHLELWTISESGLGGLQGYQRIYLGTGSTSSWGVTAMVFYGVHDSPYAYDLQSNVTSVGVNTVNVDNVTIPHNGLAVFGAGNGYPSSYYSSGWVSNDGLSPSISMTETSDFGINSAELASAYYTLPSTNSNATNRRLVTSTYTSNPYRQAGIVATFQPNTAHIVHSATLSPTKDNVANLYSSNSGLSHYQLIDDSSSSSYVYANTTNFDNYNLSSANVPNSTITRVIVNTQGYAYTPGTTNGYVLTELGKNFSGWVSGHNQAIYSATSTPDSFQNVFYTSYTGKAWQWSDISGMDLQLYLNYFYVTNVSVDIQYALNPGIKGISISPTGARTTDTLNAYYTYVPADGYSEVTSARTIYWYKDNVLQSSLTNLTSVASSYTAKGETWKFEIQVSDGEYYSAFYNSTPLTIQDTPPVITLATILPVDAYNTSNLIANYTYYDADSDIATAVNITWYKNNVLQPLLTNSTTVGAGNTTKGQIWYFKINVYDGQYWSPIQTGVLKYGAILDSPPVVNSASISTPAYSNQSLTLSTNVFDADNDPVSLTIQWYLNNVLVSALNNATTVPTSYLKHSQVWNASIEAFDGTNYSSIYWTSPITILDSPTVASNLYISPNPAYTTDNLTANYALFDQDGDNSSTSGWTISISWYKNGVLAYSNATFITSGNTSKGESWYFTIQVFDGYIYSTVYTSPSLTISNTPPVVINPVVNSNQSSLTVGTSLYTNFTVYDVDTGDTNSTTVIYWYYIYAGTTYNVTSQLTSQWNVPGTLVTSTTWYWFYQVKVSDGQNYSLLYESPLMPIGSQTNNPPTATYVNVTFVGSNSTLSQLFVNYTYYDKDGDTQSGTIIYWYKNNNLVFQSTCDSSYSCQYLPASYTTKGDSWYAVVKPKDGISFGNMNQSNTIIIGDTAPWVTNILISPSNPKTQQNLTLTYIWNDPDPSDANYSIITWYQYINGALNATYTNMTTIPWWYTQKGQNWTVSITPGDGYLANSTVYWQYNVTIIDTAPVLSNVNLTPGNPYTTDNLVANYNPFDVDGDSVSFIIVWYLYNSPQTYYGTGNLTLPSSATVKGQSWYFIITPFDGQLYGSNYTSNTVIIQNSPPTISNILINGAQNPQIHSNQTMTLTYQYFDADGDSQSGTLILWYKNGLLQGQFNGSLSISYVDLYTGDNWTVQIIPKDGSSFGLTYNGTQYTTLGYINILDTAPVITDASINPTSPTTSSTLTLSYSWYDYDGNPITYNIYWYLNDTFMPAFNNSLTIPSSNTTRGDVWYAIVNISDGTFYSNSFTTAPVTILNTPPVLSNVAVDPSSAYTTNNLNASYTQFDADGDPITIVQLYWIITYPNGTVSGPSFINQPLISSANTQEFQSWYFVIQVTDGINKSVVYQSKARYILNSPPVVHNLHYISTTVMSNGSITISFYVTDADNNVYAYYIFWYKNGVLDPSLNGLLTVDSSYLHYNDQWYVVVIPYDSFSNGTTQTLSIITILDTPPLLTNFQFSGGQYSGFYVNNETIAISYLFNDKDNNLDQSSIQWYQNGVLVPTLNGKFTVPSSYTQPGDTWKVVIRGYDGIDYGNTITRTVYVISRPQINADGIYNTTVNGIVPYEGLYTVWVNSSDAQNRLIETNITIIVLSTNISYTYILASTNGTQFMYSQNIDIIELMTKAGFTSNFDYTQFIGKTLVIDITVTTKYQNNDISSYKSFSITIKDNAAPRVLDAYYNWGNKNSPTNITFYAKIQDFGGNISSVTLYYFFANSSNPLASGTIAFYKLTATSIPYKSVKMTKINSTNSFSWYAFTVQYTPKTTTSVYFTVGTTDSNGNSNQNAYPDGNLPANISAGKFSPPNLGLSPQMVIGIVAGVLIIALIFTFVGIKRFRSTELVGLDKDLVISKIKDLKNDNEIATQMDLHSLGIIISFFDQRHGPIPIITIPEILQDNYNLLVDLSDMSFSSARFSGNFEDEIFSTYNFNPGPGQFINIISFGFALDRPSARGGAENITLNILLHKNVSELINQFIDKFQEQIHEIHVLMDKHGQEKDLITQKIRELRLFLSKIVLSYEKLYGTTELLDSYDEIFNE